MKQVALGSQGMTVSVQGLGAMGMSAFYGGRDDVESAATLHRAVDLGVTLIDTAEIYGPFLNERLIGRVLGTRRDEIVLASKFAREVFDDGTVGPVNGSPAYARKALERSLANLQTEFIDLYYMHRMDPKVPIEETMGALSEFVQEGKIRGIGLSEAAPETIRRAHAVHPVTAVQSEYSLFERSPEENDVLKTVRELGIGFVAYSPLSRGFLSGSITKISDLAEDDFRRQSPRFSEANFGENLKLVELVRAMAAEKGITPSQLALAWLQAQGVVSIPGTKRRRYLEENVVAAGLVLDVAEIAELSSIFPGSAVRGARYDESGMKSTYL